MPSVAVMRPPLVAMFGVARLFKAGSRGDKEKKEKQRLGTGEKRGVRKTRERRRARLVRIWTVTEETRVHIVVFLRVSLSRL